MIFYFMAATAERAVVPLKPPVMACRRANFASQCRNDDANGDWLSCSRLALTGGAKSSFDLAEAAAAHGLLACR